MTPCQSILIIEDDADIRDTLRQLLELEGYSVACAANGRDAMDTLAKTPHPCLILLDLMMPVMNGWQFLEAMKADDRLAPIPVVVVTAAGERAREVQASGFIRKPVEVDTLLEWVKKFCAA